MKSPKETTYPLVIRMFGPFDVRVEGRPLPPLRTRKGQWLFALLVLRYSREVQRSWLAGTLWPESGEGQAAANLRRSLTDLRQALGAQAHCLHATTAHTLTLDLTGADVDLVTFDVALRTGDPALLATAFALYRGPLLEGCTEEWVVQERQVREQAFLAASEALAEQARAAGDFAAAEGYLRRVILTDPLRETAQRALMETLAQAGDYAAATQTYRELRLLLRRELNAEPDSATTTLFQRLRSEARQRAACVEPPAPSPPVPKPSPPSRPLHNLPRPLTTFIGRGKQIAEIIARQSQSRLLTLTGAGGVGKTRLAIRVAEELVDDFPDGVWFVDLAPLTEPALVLQTVALTLGAREEPDRPLAATLTDFLRSRRLLIVLDNCEHLRAACARLTDSLLQGCPSLCVLATSRQALGILDEGVWNVPSLSFPEHRRTTLTGVFLISALEQSEAGSLFVERAASAMPNFALTERNAPAVLQICRQLDGIPLALELAAARVKVLTVEQIAARLEARFRLLTNGSPIALPRQQTLLALVDWSHDLLTEAERVLLRRLAVFVGGFTLEAAEAVCVDREKHREAREEHRAVVSLHDARANLPPLRIAEWEVLNLLAQLAEKSLVKAEEEVSGARWYRQLETLRCYGLERLEAAGELEVLRERHRDYYADLAEEAEPCLMGPKQADWLNRLEAELDNLRAALQWSVEDTTRLRLASALWRFWLLRGYLSEGRGWLQAALARSEKAAPSARAKALCGAGTLAYRQVDFVTARTLLEESVALFRSAEDRTGLAMALNELGLILSERGEPAVARTLLEESLALSRALHDKPSLARVLNRLGILAIEEDKYDLACQFYQEGLTLFREMENKQGIASILGNLANVAFFQNDFVRARALNTECLAAYQELGYKSGIADTLSNLGIVAYYQDDFAAARELHLQAMEIQRELGEKRGVAKSLSTLGSIAGRQGDYVQERAFREESLAICRELGEKRGLAVALDRLAGVVYRLKEAATGNALRWESLALWRELGDSSGLLQWIESLAYVQAETGEPLSAARLLGATEALRESLGIPLSSDEREDQRRPIAAASAALGEKAFRAAWNAGCTLSLEQSIAAAMEAGKPSL